MIKVRPQGICTEGLDRRPESKQTGKGEARIKSGLISATPIKCCRFERKHPACRGMQGRLESLIAHVSSLHANKGDEKEKQTKENRGNAIHNQQKSLQRNKGYPTPTHEQKSKIRLDDDDIAFGISGIGDHHVTIFTNCQQHSIILQVNCAVVIVMTLEALILNRESLLAGRVFEFWVLTGRVA